MKAKNMVCIVFPTLIMGAIALITFTNFINVSVFDLKGLFIISLVAVFPLLFLLQGVVAPLTKTNPIGAYLVSVATYLIIMFLYLNSSALGYVLYFGVFYLVGFFIGRYFSKK